ncbi:hypothetical protein KO481_29800 [Nocardia sp. NEAU-G5]|uniref:Uncharacterized protein n=1 Tax=Nocardia albiluteola TaxID=2842303 RepID=A0ABS6B6D7_9NOCA|nr:hypothetical protein [Nocardia albiluteola]MBU3065708.1 hypothetical protein [Nocardia albiluteola]
MPISEAQYIECRGDLDIDLLRTMGIRAGRELRREYTAPLDMTRDLLVTTAIVRLGDRHYLLYCRSHHVAMYGYGAMMIVNRIAALYTAAVQGRVAEPNRAADIRALYEADLSAKALGASPAAVVIAAFGCYLARRTGRDEVLVNIPVSGRTTAVLRRSADPGSAAEGAEIRRRRENLEFWRAALADLPEELCLPLDRPRPAVLSNRGATSSFVLDAGLVGGLEDVARRHGCSLFIRSHLGSTTVQRTRS